MNWNEFRDDVCNWSKKNFGDQTTLRPFVGIIEEAGELAAAMGSGHIYDAIGDIMVYLADFTGRRAIDMHALVINPLNAPAGKTPHEYLHDFKAAMAIFGRTCHAVLKIEQRIRVNENHQAALLDALKELVLWTRGQSGDTSLDAFERIVLNVWAEVKNRDWSSNKVDGSASPSISR